MPPVNAEYLRDRPRQIGRVGQGKLPHSKLHLIDYPHFVWEDATDEYAALVNAWWADGYKTYGKLAKATAQ